MTSLMILHAFGYVNSKQPEAERYMASDPDGCEQLGKRAISGAAGAAANVAIIAKTGQHQVGHLAGNVVSKATGAYLPDGSPAVRRVGGTLKAIWDDIF